MKQPIQKQFEAVLATNDFSLLSPYQDPLSWTAMTQDEREMLGFLLVKQGELQLINGDSKVLESFSLASQVAPFSQAVFFQQAVILASHHENIRCLMAAQQALEKAISLNPTFIAAWHGLGCVLTDISTFHNDTGFLYQADAKFVETDRLAKLNEASYPEDFFWQWGICWHKIGKSSGEAADFFKALELFQIAATRGLNQNGLFSGDYGNVLVELAFLVGRKELFITAAEQYKITVTQFPNESRGWLNLACTCQHLYETFNVEEYFLEANEYFDRVTEINPHDHYAWLKWAELHAYAGKKSKDLNLLYSSCEKFEKANLYDSNNAVTLARWGETQMVAASYTDNLALLREAQLKILKAVEIEPESAVFWYILGACLFEQGRYFNDTRYFEQAIAKFQHALSLNDAHAVVYHGMAHSYYCIGEMTGNVQIIEQALPHFNRAAELTDSPAPQLWNDWGVALMKLGEMTNEKKHIEIAIEKFEKAIGHQFHETSDKEIDLEWLYNYGCAMDFLGDFHEEPAYYERAIQVLTHTLQVDPEYSHARYNLALSLSHLGELNSDVDCFHRAIEHFRVLLESNSEDEFAWNDWGLALTHLAVLTYDAIHPEFSAEYYKDAEQKFLHAIALGNTYAFYNIACVYALTHHISAAMHYLERADASDSLPLTEDVMHDEWLDNMRQHPPFRAFISHLLNKFDG